MMIGGLLVSIVGAAMLLILMRMTAPDSNWKQRALVGAVAALFVSLVPALLNWNWWHFPVGFTVVGIIDGFIAWTLVALVMALIIPSGKNAGILRPGAEPSRTDRVPSADKPC